MERKSSDKVAWNGDWILQCFTEQIVSEILEWICFSPVQLASYQRYRMNLSILGGKSVYCHTFSLGVNKNIFIVLERFPWC